jgi:flagellin
MVINTNMAAITAASNLDNSTNKLNNSLSELSSGSKIVTPADDPAGLAESISIQSQLGESQAANSNVSNAISFSQTQDGYLQQVGAALDQMATLAVEAQDVTKNSSELSDYQAEFKTLATYISTTAGAVFNGVSLFSATTLDVTIDSTVGHSFAMTGIDLTATVYANVTSPSTSIATPASAAIAEGYIQAAITALASDRSTIGANEDGLTYTMDELNVLQDNLTAANSNITDVDVATEATKYAEYQILVQSGTSMLAQANQNPQSVLKLLQ